MNVRALLLTPSKSLGGGIERYAETLECALRTQGVLYSRIDLHRRGAAGHMRMFVEARKQIRAFDGPVRLILTHRTLLPIGSVLARIGAVCGVSVVCHGCDVWAGPSRVRGYVEHRLMRKNNVRVVAVSSFTAGVMFGNSPAVVLPPGLSREWFELLVGASAEAPRRRYKLNLLTTFRLADWRGKGLPELLHAIAELPGPDVGITVCGAGVPSTELKQLVARYHFCTLLAGLTDPELARARRRRHLRAGHPD